LRFNPFLNDWVMIEANRQQRPNMPADWCPFCPGSGKVPADYDVYHYDNDFPVLRQQWSDISPADDFYLNKSTYGKCEVILYHPDHHMTLPRLPVSHIRKLVDLWCSRSSDLAADENIKYIYIFENRGKESGTTMPHPHGQLYAFGWIPKLIQTELDASRDYFDKHGECLMCTVLRKETADGSRIVYENDSFVCFVPYFTAWPYGTYIVPKKHTGSLTGFDSKQRDDLAGMLKTLTGAYDGLYDELFPYMMAIHQSPVNSPDADEYYHIHIEFYPPLRAQNVQYFRASCETGAGVYCNVTLPEEKARELRAAAEKYLQKESCGGL
jgi:UDPglucose--hexose-1-phosphate uridylyltransferase